MTRMVRRSMRSHATDNPATVQSRRCRGSLDSVVFCDGYLRLKKKNALTWSTRYVVLKGKEMRVYSSKNDEMSRRSLVDVMDVTEGNIAPRGDLCVEWKTKDGKEMLGRAFNRADLAKWITAFHRLALRSSSMMKQVKVSGDSAPFRSNQDEESTDSEDDNFGNPVVQAGSASTERASLEKRRVTFLGSVLVRTIPNVAEEDVPELFYSKADMQKFSAQASSLLCRTEDAVHIAVQSLRRPSLSFRRPVAQQ
ncbi:TPA: hypothetical protein N0F65_013053 [Lagenidium giganteum]|uniref:PH domain-containing protein n=1 Tax=Lagenidium giganteum TaxID=4803 RepID=A0AAV2YN34_9STRA|nr:TPA: hypothetical protein N0F65_013053 [Lagenidium giganteum]